MRTISLATALAAVLLLPACAGMNVKKISTTDDDKDTGLRFYRNVPYLLVTTNNQGGVTTEVTYLPDTNELMSAHVYSQGASNETSLKFKDSVLTSATVDVDTTVIPKTVLNTIATLVSAGVFNVAGGEESSKKAPGPYLYRIKVRGSTAELIGSDEVISINIGTEPKK